MAAPFWSRRNFLQVGAASAFGLTLAYLLKANAYAAGSQPRPSARSCILVWLNGGPPTIDMWDMKPDAPVEIRGEFKPINTAVPGLTICEYMPELAKVMDCCTLVRSVAHALADHDPGSELVLTGRTPSPSLKYPSVGAVAAQLLTGSAGVPSYLSLGESSSVGTSGFLGASAKPFEVRPADLRSRTISGAPVELPNGFTAYDLTRRESLLRELERSFAAIDQHRTAEAELSSFQAKALDILRSNRTRKALDISSESMSVSEAYGLGWAGQALLAARRLVEAGVGFVSVSLTGWDTHAGNFRDLRTALLPQLDKALAALLVDLKQRGLLEETLVYCVGEFGRTPHVNRQGGRDHWPRAMSVLLAGGRLRSGTAYGSTDAHGLEPSSDACSPADVNATVLAQLGVQASTTLTTPAGRPISVYGDGSPLAGIVA